MAELSNRAGVQYDVEVEVLRIIKADEARSLLTLEEGFRACEEAWTHPGKVEAPYTVCIASASNLTGL